MEASGTMISMPTMGSRTIGRGPHRFDHRPATGGDEGNLLAVDRVGLAVVNRHFQGRRPRNPPPRRLPDLAHALSTAAMKTPGITPLDRIDKLDAFAAAQWLDAQMNLAELPGAATLLLVAVNAFGGGNRFTVGDASAAWYRLPACT